MDFEGNNMNMMLCNSSSKEQNGNNTSNNNNSGNFGWDSLWEQTSSSSSNFEASLYSHVQLDPHLTCLKLGNKRDYFEDGGGLPGKRGKTAASAAAAVARCQVEGCHVALVNAKEYHRRHKVCEMHSKAPNVVVLGLDQRFCQQCSRFHVVSEFDDSKRSCRRRLAGHNERRRKSFHDSLARTSSQENKSMVEGFPYLSSSSSWSSSSSLGSSLPPPPLSSECALSLLSSSKDDHSCLSPSDLSTRCSAALRELIAENRAAVMAKQIILEREPHHGIEEEDDLKEIQTQSNYNFPQHHQMFP